MKKIISIILVLSLVLSLSACGSAQTETTVPTVTPTVSPTASPTTAPTVTPTETPEVEEETETSDWVSLPSGAVSGSGSSGGENVVTNLSSLVELSKLTELDDGEYAYTASASDVVEDAQNGDSITFSSETSGSVTIDTSAIEDDVNVIVYMPNAHVEVTVITQGTLTATTSDTTLVLLDGSSVGTLVVLDGNVVVKSGSEVELTAIGTIASGSNVVVEVGGKLKGNGTLNGQQTMDYVYSGSEWVIDDWSNHADISWFDEQITTFEISTAEQLAGVATLLSAKETTFAEITITIADDIDLVNKYWTPIGTSTRSGDGFDGDSTPFMGTFDGGSKTIDNLTIDSTVSGDIGVGLFSGVQGATLKNIILDNVSIVALSSKAVGGIAGIASYITTVSEETTYTQTVIDNCYVLSGSIEGIAVGGIVGRVLSIGEISNSSNGANVSSAGGDAAGGIVGKAYYGEVEGQYINIDNCSNSGIITSSDYDQTGDSNFMAGGIAGFSVANISDCTNTGAVYAEQSAGGIAGEMQAGYIVNCENTGAISFVDGGDGYAGGIVGWLRYSSSLTSSYNNTEYNIVKNNSNSGDILGKGAAGGIVGLLYDAGYIYENANTASKIEATTFASGIVGGLQNIGNTTYTNSYEVMVAFNESTTTAITGSCTNDFAYNNTSKEGSDYFFVDFNSGSILDVKAFVIEENTTIPKTLIIPEGYTLTVSNGVTLTNNGTITVEGTLVNEGTIVNNGTIESLAAITGSGALTNNGIYSYVDSDGAIVADVHADFDDFVTDTLLYNYYNKDSYHRYVPTDLISSYQTTYTGTNYANNIEAYVEANVYYNLGSVDVSEITSLTIGGVTYSVDTLAECSVGNSAFIHLYPAIISADGDLLINPFAIAAESAEGKVEVVIDGELTYKLTIVDPELNKTLSIDDSSYATGYTNSKVDETSVSGNTVTVTGSTTAVYYGYVDVRINLTDGTGVLSGDIYIIRKTSTESFGVTTPETGSNPCTYCYCEFFLSSYYGAFPITRSVDLNLYVVGIGRIDVHLDVVSVASAT